MRNTFLEIQKLSHSLEPRIPHISMFIPLDGDESTHFTNLYRKSKKLLTQDNKATIQKFHVDWTLYINKGFKAVALYLTHKGHVIVGLPFKMSPNFIIGDTFHVKPLLLLKDYQKRSLILHFKQSGVTLYKVSSQGFKVIDSFIPSTSKSKLQWPEEITGKDLRTYLEFIKDNIALELKGDIVSLLVTGLDQKRLYVKGFWDFKDIDITYCFEDFYKQVPTESIKRVQRNLEKMIDSDYEAHISDFLESKLKGEFTFDFFKLNHLIQNKMIEKLYVSLEDIIFGSICEKTGDATVNMKQKDTRDKDILNSFLMLCLERNIDVKVIPKKFFPPGLSFVYS